MKGIVSSGEEVKSLYSSCPQLENLEYNSIMNQQRRKYRETDSACSYWGVENLNSHLLAWFYWLGYLSANCSWSIGPWSRGNHELISTCFRWFGKYRKMRKDVVRLGHVYINISTFRTSLSYKIITTHSWWQRHPLGPIAKRVSGATTTTYNYQKSSMSPSWNSRHFSKGPDRILGAEVRVTAGTIPSPHLTKTKISLRQLVSLRVQGELNWSLL